MNEGTEKSGGGAAASRISESMARSTHLELKNRDLALKYLELSRAEILEKVRFVNQTLGAYLLGASAVTAWFYQLYRPPVSSGGAMPAHSVNENLAAVGLTAMLSYIALGVSWIINHNERMVTALALYQRDDLRRELGDQPPMWEVSRALCKRDGAGRAAVMILIQQGIVLIPPVLSLIISYRKLSIPSPSTLLNYSWMFALLATGCVCWIAGLTLTDRLLFRRNQGNVAGGPPARSG